jgi:hypothetical protein
MGMTFILESKMNVSEFAKQTLPLIKNASFLTDNEGIRNLHLVMHKDRGA